MKPAARIQTAIDILERIENSRVPMDTTCGDYFRVRRYIGSKDRAVTVQRVYDVTREHARLGWWLEKNRHEDTPRARLLAHLVLVEDQKEKRLRDLFDGSKYAPEPLSQAEIALIQKLQDQKLDHPGMPLPVRVECPPLYEDSLRVYFGDEFEQEMLALIEPAPLDLRVNTYQCPRDKAKSYLEADGIETDETPYSPWGLRARGKAFLSKTKAFAKGWIEIQDEGSQMIAYLCDPRPGQQVLDYCAGAGGKTLALAAAMEKKGRIVAMDTEERRLDKGRARFKKAGLADMIEVRPLSDDQHRRWLRRQKGTFDLVLLDVPCTGTGTWRRNPDMRWKTYGPGLEELVEIQKEILEKTAKTVKPGGRLVYATCSLLSAENEEQVAHFLGLHAEFRLKPVSEKLGGNYMRLTPQRHNTDGFFAAILEKTV